MTLLTDKTYTQTFGSLGFFWLGNGGRTVPIIGRVAVYQRDKIPFGNNTVLQRSGYDYTPLARQIVIKSADLSAWLAALNTTALLTITGNSALTAYLAQFDGGELYPDAAGGLTANVKFEF